VVWFVAVRGVGGALVGEAVFEEFGEAAEDVGLVGVGDGAGFAEPEYECEYRFGGGGVFGGDYLVDGKGFFGWRYRWVCVIDSVRGIRRSINIILWQVMVPVPAEE